MFADRAQLLLVGGRPSARRRLRFSMLRRTVRVRVVAGDVAEQIASSDTSRWYLIRVAGSGRHRVCATTTPSAVTIGPRGRLELDARIVRCVVGDVAVQRWSRASRPGARSTARTGSGSRRAAPAASRRICLFTMRPCISSVTSAPTGCAEFGSNIVSSPLVAPTCLRRCRRSFHAAYFSLIVRIVRAPHRCVAPSLSLTRIEQCEQARSWRATSSSRRS